MPAPGRKCKHCGSKNVVKAGKSYAGGVKQRWLCKDCHRHHYGETPTEKRPNRRPE